MTHPHDGGGIVAPLASLIRARPDRRTTGFAPAGRVATHQFGTNRSVFRGRGMEFDESRVYQSGDDMRSIDWRVTARTGELFTKLFHEERERPVMIFVDLGASMRFGSRVQFKSVLAAQIAAALAWVGIDGGDRVGGFITTDDGLKSQAPSRSQAKLLTFLKAMSQATAAPVGDATEPAIALASVFDRIRRVSRPGTLCFMISDFLSLDERAARSLSRLSLHAHVTNIMVNDPLDEILPYGRQRISDGTQSMSLSAVKRGAIDAYAASYRDRRERLQTLCRTRGMALHTITTEANVREVLKPHRKTARSRTHGHPNARWTARQEGLAA